MAALLTFLRRLGRRVADAGLPPCPFCDSRLPVEPSPARRWFCPGCGKDFGATVASAAADPPVWVYDREPLRYKARRFA